jgi:hypothetical protein
VRVECVFHSFVTCLWVDCNRDFSPILAKLESIPPQHSVKTDELGNSYVELDGQRVDFDNNNFSSKSIGISDIVRMAMNHLLQDTAFGKMLTKFGTNLKEGEQSTLILAGTVVVGGLILYYMLGSAGPGAADSSKQPSGSQHGSKKKSGHHQGTQFWC